MRTLIVIPALFVCLLAFPVNNDFVKACALIDAQDYNNALLKIQQLNGYDTTGKNKLEYYQGICFYNLKNYTLALDCFNESAKLGNTEAWLWAAKSAAKLNDVRIYYFLGSFLDSAIAPDVKEIKQIGDFQTLKNTDGWLGFWQQQENSERVYNLTEAIFWLKKQNFNRAVLAAEKLNNGAEKSFLKARAYNIANDFPSAQQWVNTAIKQKPGNIKLLLYKSKLLKQNGYIGNAITIMEQVTSTEPEMFDARQQLIGLYLQNGNNLKAYNGAVVLNQLVPQQPKVLILLAQSMVELNKSSEALKTIAEYIKIAGENERTYYLRGRAYYSTGTYLQSLKDFTMCLDLAPNNGEYYYYSGLNYMKINKQVLACHAFKKAYAYNYMQAYNQILNVCK